VIEIQHHTKILLKKKRERKKELSREKKEKGRKASVGFVK
jgi:hypothetical protein